MEVTWQLVSGPALYVPERQSDRPEMQLALDITGALELKESLLAVTAMPGTRTYSTTAHIMSYRYSPVSRVPDGEAVKGLVW